MLKAAVIPVTPFQQNCSLVWDDVTMVGAFVDPGGDVDALLSAASRVGVDVKSILITHAHVDHAGAAQDIKEQLHIPIIGPHKDDQFWIDLIEDSGQKYGMKYARAFKPDRWLDDGDEVMVGGEKLGVVHCPGHTPGHVVFYHEGQSVAFVGDVIFKGSVGRTDFPRGNTKDLIDAITQKLWPLGDAMTFVPGHGPSSTFGEERQSNPYVADHVLKR